jgi:hypothetical protein
MSGSHPSHASHASQPSKSAAAKSDKPTPPLFILVNGKRFTEDTGVTAEMDYKSIAALVDIKERQVVRRAFAGGEPRFKDVAADETVVIEPGMAFAVEAKAAPEAPAAPPKK